MTTPLLLREHHVSLHDDGDLPLIAAEAPVDDVVAALEDATARLAR